MITESMAKRKNIKSFFYISLLIISFCYLFLILFSDGEILQNAFFVTNRFNQWGDFFGPISWIKTYRNPYEPPSASYPALHYIFFHFFAKILNVAGAQDSYSLMISQYGSMLYLMLNIFFSILLTLATSELLETKNKYEHYFFTIFLLISQPFMAYALKQGNSSYICLVLICLSLCLQALPSKIFKEIALILIAISAGFKIFPALLGLFYVKEKRWSEGIRLVVYGVLLFFLPFFYYGFTESFSLFLRNLNNSNTFITSPGTVPHVVSVICNKLHFTSNIGFLMSASTVLYLIFVLALFFKNSVSFSNTYLFYSLFVVLSKTQQPYCLVYFTIPLISWLNYTVETGEERLSIFDFIMPISFLGMLFCYNWYIEYAFVWLGIVYCAARELRIAARDFSRRHLLIIVAVVTFAIIALALPSNFAKYKAVSNPIKENMVEGDISLCKYNVDAQEKKLYKRLVLLRQRIRSFCPA